MPQEPLQRVEDDLATMKAALGKALTHYLDQMQAVIDSVRGAS